MEKRDIINAVGEDPVFENDSVMGVRSDYLKENILIGSYVIIPKTQVETPFDLSEKEWVDTQKIMNEIKAYLDEKYKPDGYNLGWNVGEVGGQNVAHAHFHILPRYKDEPYAGKGIRAWIKKEENLRECFKNEKID